MPTVGVSDHAGWAVLVTIDDSGQVIDRRRVVLKDEALPGLPHHDASRRLPLAAAVEMVETVRQSAAVYSVLALDGLARAVARPIHAIALRIVPDLPGSVAERITNTWANARADGVLFREALAEAARRRGWRVGWFDPRHIIAQPQAPEFARIEAAAAQRFSPPWNADHRTALAGALACSAWEA